MELVAASIATFAGIAYAMKKPVSLRRLPPKPGRGECQEHDGRSALVLPMHADENSIFLVDIGVEDDDGNVQWVEVAVDTGSESLMIASSDCKVVKKETYGHDKK